MLHRFCIFTAGSIEFLVFILMYCQLVEKDYVWAAVNFIALVSIFIKFVAQGDE